MPERALSRILPPNSTRLERAILDASASIDHDVDAIRRQLRPGEIDAALLPWLAWSVDVMVWPRTAPESLRRHLVKDSYRMHRLPGTLAGLKRVAELAGGKIVGAITPPAKPYAAPALSLAERNAFVARYPQLRIYRYRTLGQRIGLHCGDTLGRRPPVQSDALLRLLPRAYLWRDGVETELTLIERTQTSHLRTASTAVVTEVAIPGRAQRLSFVGGHPRHLTVTDSPRRFYRLALADTYRDSSETLRRVAATPGIDPIDVRPDAIAQTGTATSIHAGQYVARYLSPSTARDRLYQRLHLFDPEIAVNWRRATLHLNAGRLGMPPHHAELALRINATAHKQAAGRYCRGYLIRTDKQVLAECLESMRTMARVSDRIAIDTAINRPVSAGNAVTAGQATAGDWIAN